MATASERRLSVFKTVVERRGINAAADYLGIAQPSVTAHIKSLEASFGVELFTRRRGRRIELTPAGEIIYAYAHDVTTRLEQVDQALKALAAKRSVEFTLAVQRSIADFLSAELARFLASHPGAQISFHTDVHEGVEQLVRDGKVDLGILFIVTEPRDLVARQIGVQDLVFVAAPDHRLAGRTGLTAEDIRQHPFVGGLVGSHYYKLISAAIRRFGIEEYKVVMHLQDANSVKRAVASNLGIACTLAANVADDVKNGTLVMLDTARPIGKMPIYVLHRPLEELPAIVSDFIEDIRNCRYLVRGKPG